jgi:hypothetical protein
MAVRRGLAYEHLSSETDMMVNTIFFALAELDQSSSTNQPYSARDHHLHGKRLLVAADLSSAIYIRLFRPNQDRSQVTSMIVASAYIALGVTAIDPSLFLPKF